MSPRNPYSTMKLQCVDHFNKLNIEFTISFSLANPYSELFKFLLLLEKHIISLQVHASLKFQSLVPGFVSESALGSGSASALTLGLASASVSASASTSASASASD